MARTRRPRFIAAVLLLRDAFGRFMRLRQPTPVRDSHRTAARKIIKMVSVQLVLF